MPVSVRFCGSLDPSAWTAATDTSAAWARMCSSPSSGWSDTYSPSISRSNCSNTFLSHSTSGTRTANTSSTGAPEPSSSPSPANRSNWPMASARLVSSTASTAASNTLISPRRAWPRESKAAALDQTFDGALVAHDGVDLLEEVPEVGVVALGLAGGHDRAHDVRAHVADGGQPEADVGAGRREVGLGLVHAGRQDLDPHVAAFGQVNRHLVLVVLDRGQQRRHVLGREVGLEVGRPVRHQPVGGRVRLVEGVVGEGQQDVPQAS